MPEVYQKPLKYGYLHINDTAVILMSSALEGLYCIYKAITLASFATSSLSCPSLINCLFQYWLESTNNYSPQKVMRPLILCVGCKIMHCMQPPFMQYSQWLSSLFLCQHCSSMLFSTALLRMCTVSHPLPHHVHPALRIQPTAPHSLSMHAKLNCILPPTPLWCSCLVTIFLIQISQLLM